MLIVCVILSFLSLVSSYSISYSTNSDESQIYGNTLSMSVYPKALQVADIYMRLGGLSPLLREDNLDLPSRSMLAKSQNPMLLEVHGGVLPETVIPVAVMSNSAAGAEEPSFKEVVSILNRHGVQPKKHSISGNGIDIERKVQDFLIAQKEPVVIMHYGDNSHRVHRSLVNSTNTTSSTNSSIVTPLTEFQISQYQICLWTGVVMFLLVLASLCSIVNMEVIPDSLLFAKFQSSRTTKQE